MSYLPGYTLAALAPGFGFYPPSDSLPVIQCPDGTTNCNPVTSTTTALLGSLPPSAQVVASHQGASASWVSVASITAPTPPVVQPPSVIVLSCSVTINATHMSKPAISTVGNTTTIAFTCSDVDVSYS